MDNITLLFREQFKCQASFHDIRINIFLFFDKLNRIIRSGVEREKYYELVQMYQFPPSVAINDIECDTKMFSIVLKYPHTSIVNITEKFNYIPLSEYIVINKVNTRREMERHLCNEEEWNSNYLLLNVFYAIKYSPSSVSVDSRQKFTYDSNDISYSSYFEYESDLNKQKKILIINSIYYAFAIHVSNKLIRELIMKLLLMIDKSVKWKCEIEILNNAKHESNAVKGSKGYFRARYSEKEFMKEEECVCVSINSVPLSMEEQSQRQEKVKQRSEQYAAETNVPISEAGTSQVSDLSLSEALLKL
jgi:hypothetical protein